MPPDPNNPYLSPERQALAALNADRRAEHFADVQGKKYSEQSRACYLAALAGNLPGVDESNYPMLLSKMLDYDVHNRTDPLYCHRIRQNLVAAWLSTRGDGLSTAEQNAIDWARKQTADQDRLIKRFRPKVARASHGDRAPAPDQDDGPD